MPLDLVKLITAKDAKVAKKFSRRTGSGYVLQRTFHSYPEQKYSNSPLDSALKEEHSYQPIY